MDRYARPSSKAYQARGGFAGVDRGGALPQEDVSLDTFVSCHQITLIRDDSVAAYIDAERHLLPHHNEPDTKVDRYDVRLLLDDLSSFSKPSWSRSGEAEPLVSDEEMVINQERYRDLDYAKEHLLERPFALPHSPSALSGSDDGLDDAADAARHLGKAGTYQAMPLDYSTLPTVQPQTGAPVPKWPFSAAPAAAAMASGPSSTAGEDDVPFYPSFAVPEHLRRHMPKTQRQNKILMQTAKFVRENGGQVEVVLRLKQASNPNFGFLMPADPGFPYYRWVVETDPKELHMNAAPDLEAASKPSAVLAPSPPPAPRQVPASVDALSLLRMYSGEQGDGHGPGSTPSSRAGSEEPVAGAVGPSFPGAMAEEAGDGGEAGPVFGPAMPPASTAEDGQQGVGDNKASGDVPEQANRVEQPASEEAEEAEAQPQEQEPGVPGIDDVPDIEEADPVLGPEPSKDMKAIMDKLVAFVKKSGIKFEAMVRQRERNNPKFVFLQPWNPFHWYYRQQLEKAMGTDAVRDLLDPSTLQLPMTELPPLEAKKPDAHPAAGTPPQASTPPQADADRTIPTASDSTAAEEAAVDASAVAVAPGQGGAEAAEAAAPTALAPAQAAAPTVAAQVAGPAAKPLMRILANPSFRKGLRKALPEGEAAGAEGSDGPEAAVEAGVEEGGGDSGASSGGKGESEGTDAAANGEAGEVSGGAIVDEELFGGRAEQEAAADEEIEAEEESAASLEEKMRERRLKAKIMLAKKTASELVQQQKAAEQQKARAILHHRHFFLREEEPQVRVPSPPRRKRTPSPPPEEIEEGEVVEAPPRQPTPPPALPDKQPVARPLLYLEAAPVLPSLEELVAEAAAAAAKHRALIEMEASNATRVLAAQLLSKKPAAAKKRSRSDDSSTGTSSSSSSSSGSSSSSSDSEDEQQARRRARRSKRKYRTKHEDSSPEASSDEPAASPPQRRAGDGGSRHHPHKPGGSRGRDDTNRREEEDERRRHKRWKDDPRDEDRHRSHSRHAEGTHREPERHRHHRDEPDRDAHHRHHKRSRRDSGSDDEEHASKKLRSKSTSGRHGSSDARKHHASGEPGGASRHRKHSKHHSKGATSDDSPPPAHTSHAKRHGKRHGKEADSSPSPERRQHHRDDHSRKDAGAKGGNGVLHGLAGQASAQSVGQQAAAAPSDELRARIRQMLGKARQ